MHFNTRSQLISIKHLKSAINPRRRRVRVAARRLIDQGWYEEVHRRVANEINTHSLEICLEDSQLMCHKKTKVWSRFRRAFTCDGVGQSA